MVEIVEWMKVNWVDEVVGFGIDYCENDWLFELFWKVYCNVCVVGFCMIVYVGEFGMLWCNVEMVVDLL